jgi:hypothetical protein
MVCPVMKLLSVTVFWPFEQQGSSRIPFNVKQADEDGRHWGEL